MIDDLPDTSTWRPTQARSDNLKQTFFLKCKQIEALTLARKEHEQQLSQYNFDSGPGVEDIVREGIRDLLPSRYHVTSGTVSDSVGFTAGDCDIVIFNDHWFPTLKKGATEASRRRIMPIEGTYAIIEVKQTLDFKSLDSAMQKLVTCHRLHRPDSPFDRITENRESGDCTHFISNPLYSGIIATGLGPGLSLMDIADRFVRINQLLPRRDVIRSLCVLGEGTILWAVMEEDQEANATKRKYSPAMFTSEDLYLELHPAFFPTKEEGCALYEMTTNLLGHLFHSVLAPDDLAAKYGPSSTEAKFPDNEGASLKPDPAMLNSLHNPCH